MNALLEASKKTYGDGKTYYRCTRNELETANSYRENMTEAEWHAAALATIRGAA